MCSGAQHPADGGLAAESFTSDLSDLVLDTEYRTGESNPVAEFYGPCLSRARTYDRAVGYFRSSVFAVTGPSIMVFARSGGRLRLVCSPDLTAEDWDALQQGYEQRDQILSSALLREVEALEARVDSKRGVEVLATLVMLGILDVRVAVRPPSQGIFHEKIGIFGDCQGHYVSFKGSSNETWNGWHERGNFESIEVFCSWRDAGDQQRIARHREYFERLWGGHIRHLDVIELPRAFALRLAGFAKANLNALMSTSTRTAARTPLPHQTDALHAWRSAGYRGILEHATGSGKTFTALLAIEEHVALGGLALVVVPSRLLLEQWAREIQGMLPDAALLIAGGGRRSWRVPGRLERFTAPQRTIGARVVLATMATAANEEFRTRIRSGEHLLLVADEVHQMGSPQYSHLTDVDAAKRLGLSATPRRFGDPDGSRALFAYFGGVIPPVFDLRAAIGAGRLVQYTYFPHPVYLAADEAGEWRTLSRQITKEVVRLPKQVDGSFALSERVRLLLIRRAKIAKKARAKIRLAQEVVCEHYIPGEHWLVYCEDSDQLKAVLGALRAAGIEAKEYHTRMAGDANATLTWFTQFGGVLVSIRCLDEGVDIPQISHAVILASSQNPRQFIQRRGRVLRSSPGKHIAVIHDAIVIPTDSEAEPEQMALARSEIARALEFAETSLNRAASAEVREIAIQLGINVDALHDTGVEEDTADE